MREMTELAVGFFFFLPNLERCKGRGNFFSCKETLSNILSIFILMTVW